MILHNKIIDYKESKKALMAFNIQNVTHLKILADVASSDKVAVMAQVSQRYIEYLDELVGLQQLVQKYQNEYLTFHLDHCMDMDLIKHCIDSGFASVMYDGSSLPLNENIENTNSIYRFASQRNCLLEAELGPIGGVEDGVGTEVGDFYSPDELVVFAKEAQFDMLALAIGNAHGHYASTQDIKIDLLKQATEATCQHLYVLHGGTDMPDEMIRQAIEYGVVKINVSTALKTETINTMKEFCLQHDEFNESDFFSLMNSSLSKFYRSYTAKFSQ